MGQPVVSGAATVCTMGLSPSSLVVLPDKSTTVENLPVATILDNRPYVNIVPFGLCNSLANPLTAAQTTAALGVLTPGMCTPVMPAPWVPGSPTSLVRNVPMLSASSKCMCAYGGVVSVTMSPTTRTNVP